MKTAPRHRTFIGPAEHYELLSGRHFMLLFALGMREQHRFLDFGCGSLRSGRLIMTYLAPYCYYGIDPNKWLIGDAVEQEVGRSLIKIKKPQFAFHSDGRMTSFGTQFDFIHAHSVLTHAAPTLARTFFMEAGKVLTPNGLVVATFLRGESDYDGADWAYPDVFPYRIETMTRDVRRRHRTTASTIFEKENFTKPRDTTTRLPTTAPIGILTRSKTPTSTAMRPEEKPSARRRSPRSTGTRVSHGC